MIKLQQNDQFIYFYTKIDIFMLSITLTISLFYLSLSAMPGYSALNMCGSIGCEINLNYASGIYNLTIPNAYAKTHSTIVFCYRLRPVVNSTNQQCTLNGYDSDYKCYSINFGFISNSSLLNSSISTFNSSATLVPLNTPIAASSAPTVSNSISSVEVKGFANNSVYQAVVGSRNDLVNDPDSKLVFFHTFASNQTEYSGSLFMQRNVQCILFFYESYFNYNLIFYGGTLREDKNSMYFHFLSYLSSDGVNVDENGVLNMWGGLGFSSSHTRRDMIAYSSGFGNTSDMYSLLFTAPYLDISDVVNGTEDFTQVSNSYTGSYTYYHAVGGFRLYDTADTTGDEIIQLKMNNKYCYAAAYSSDLATAITPSIASFPHQFTYCWSPDITVWQMFKKAEIFVILSILILLSY